MTLYGLDEFNNKRIKFTYTKAFPVTVGEVLSITTEQSEEIEISQ